MLAKVVKCFSDSVAKKNVNGEVISTEELMRRIEDFNKERLKTESKEEPGKAKKLIPMQNNKLTVFSMDVTALYPSINIDMATKAVHDL